jgi:arylsulfatase A
MERFNFIKNTEKMFKHFLVFAFIGLFMNNCQQSQDKKWNIVFILSDDQGWNQTTMQGSKYYEMPNIQRLADQGIYFTNAYSANPVCSPSRASIMTGKNPARLHITDYIPGSPYPYQKLSTPHMQMGLPLQEVTIAEVLKENGYVTGIFGKWHLNKDKNYEPGRPGDPGSQGFDEVLATVKPEPDADPSADAHHAVEITKRSIEFIEKHKDEAFFCYVAHHVVHRPIMETPELVKKYEQKEGADLPINNPIMGAMIERMDTGIGQILDKLDQLNLTDKTIVFFVSDNGGLEQLQDQYPLRGGKAMVFEGGIRVPVVIKWPGVIKAGIQNDTPIIHDDLFPTILDMLNIPDPVKIQDGLSIKPLFTKGGTIDRNALYFHYPHYHHQGFKPAGAVREGDYKLIEWFEQTLRGEEGQVNLYNLKEDIGEEHDLSKEMPELTNSLREKLHAWRKRVGAQEMTVNPNYDPKRAEMRFAEGEEQN